jgi:hypothetical protein
LARFAELTAERLEAIGDIDYFKVIPEFVTKQVISAKDRNIPQLIFISPPLQSLLSSRQRLNLSKTLETQTALML